METLVASSINLFILLIFMVFKLRAPLRTFVSQRHSSISQEIHLVHEQLLKAQGQYDEFSGKHKSVGAEVEVLRQQMKQDSASVKQRILSEAKRLALVLGADAKDSAEGLYAELKGQLYFELSSRIMDKVENLLREKLSGDDRIRIRHDFTSQVEKVS